MRFQLAERVKRLPPYLFAELERIINEKRQQGVNLISLSIGDPDLPPPPFVLEALREESSNPKNHNYSFSQGEPFFREAVAEWYKARFKVDLDPRREVIALIGSKEGIANFSRAFINPGDRVLVPDPAYPVYANGSTLLSDGIPVLMPLLEENNFKPDLDSLDLNGIKMVFLNYPNNPTGSIISKDELKAIIDLAREKNVIVCYDNAYSEITFDGYKAPSILEVDGAMDVAIEFHSCSKTFNMTGDRIGFAVGNSELIDGLVKVKSQIDSGPPVYIQKVAAKALQSYSINGEPPEYIRWVNRVYAERRDALLRGLRSIGLEAKKPLATFYVWARCGGSSIEFASKLLDAGVIVAPGIGFGKYGEGYVRFSITQPKELIEEACERIRRVMAH
ncbi:MAG: aminotransferase class I/II-fold pyridoxal phosphate-dependent enzyme [Candidatus Bathyarchaeia archaeon]|nr:aminotransferase class I/II-fold pyridoxal phosphate-dependent enzyme [Candidatus Bathyarchaeota archaeon]